MRSCSVWVSLGLWKLAKSWKRRRAFLMKRGEGGGLGAALGGGADAVSEEVLGEELAGH